MNHSRRTFLRSSAAGLSFAWGGMTLVMPSTATAKTPGAGEFIYGTHVYRPPNPPRSMRREVLRTIAQEHKFGLIRCFPTWDYYNPERDRYDFSEIEEVMKYCDEFGLKVMMGVVLETAPYWLERAHPETRFVDAKGQPQQLETKQAHITGGWPGLCLDWEPVQQEARKFIGELAKVVAPHSSMFVWDVWNEPHIEPAWTPDIWATPPEKLFCYCAQTIREFRQWLQQRYGTIARLNNAWTRRYPDWESITPPRSLATSADWVDWRRYTIDRSTRDMKFRCESVRAFDSRHLLESHAAHQPPLGGSAVDATDAWRLAELVDVWGITLFPHQPGSRVSDGAARLEVVRSNAPGKDFWVTELQGGDTRTGLVSGGFNMRPRDIRLWNWLAVAAGAKGIIYWQYMAESTGRESTRHGLVLRDNAPTDRVQEAARNNRLIQKHWDIIRDYRPKAEVAMLFDQDNALLTFALAGNESASTSSFTGYYRALWNMDLWVDFIEPAQLGRIDYKVLIVPWHLIGKRETCDALRKFAEAGGTLILEAAFGLFDEQFYYNAVIPPHGLRDVLGYREKQNSLVRPEPPNDSVSPTERIYYQPEIRFSAPVEARVKAHTFLTPLDVGSATTIGTFDGMPVAITKRVGRGKVFYFGTNLGAAIASGDAGAAKLVRNIVAETVKPEVTASNVRPRLIRGAKQSLLAIFNDTPQDQQAHVDIPMEFHRATDVHSGAAYAIERNAVDVTVPHQDAVVLLLS